MNNWEEGCDFHYFPGFQKQAAGLGLAHVSLSDTAPAGEQAGGATPNLGWPRRGF